LHTLATDRYSGNTVVKNLAQITAAKLDLEFSVDPLFRKTSAAFDQGGARGLLMNHLASQVS
jgi:condensin complex subunit 2